jgi:hypothetical protein
VSDPEFDSQYHQKKKKKSTWSFSLLLCMIKGKGKRGRRGLKQRELARGEAKASPWGAPPIEGSLYHGPANGGDRQDGVEVRSLRRA